MEAGGVVTLSAGDTNADGIDDLAVGTASGAAVYYGASGHMLTKSTALDVSTGFNSVRIFREKIGDYSYQTYLGVLGSDKYVGNLTENNCQTGKISIFTYNSNKDKFENSESQSVKLLDNMGAFCWYSPLGVNLELTYANHALLSPYVEKYYPFKSGDIRENDATLESDDVPNSIFYNRGKPIEGGGWMKYDSNRSHVYYDLQVADLNGTGNETIFYKTAEIASERGWTKFQTGATSPNIANHNQSITINPASTIDNRRAGVYAVVAVDDDAFTLRYTGEHRFEYTEPTILALLSSPPYFKDLIHLDGLSDSYSSSATTYGTSKTTGKGFSNGGSITAGGYISFEQDLGAFGLTAASFETELNYEAGFTEEYQHMREVTFTKSYEIAAGADGVVLYSIPYEFFEYEMTFVDPEDKEKKTINKTIAIPKNPCTQLFELSEYKAFCAKYPELPQITDNSLKHTIAIHSSHRAGVV